VLMFLLPSAQGLGLRASGSWGVLHAESAFWSAAVRDDDWRVRLTALLLLLLLVLLLQCGGAPQRVSCSALWPVASLRRCSTWLRRGCSRSEQQAAQWLGPATEISSSWVVCRAAGGAVTRTEHWTAAGGIAACQGAL